MRRDNDSEMMLFSCLGLLGVFTLSVILASILNGWVLSLMWSWFVVPKFGLPPLSIAESIFVAMIVSYLTYQPVEIKSEGKSKSWVEITFSLAGKPLVTLFVAYIILQFLPTY